MSDTDQMISNAEAGVAEPAQKRSFDPGFRRNMFIVGGAILVGIAVIATITLTARAKIDESKPKIAETSIGGGSGLNSSSPTALTPAEEARLSRVQTKESDAASEKKDTYIPRDIPAKTAPLANDSGSGPGPGYNINVGERSVQAVDQQRELAIKKGLEIQLAGLIARMEPPGTQQAPAYQAPQGSAQATPAQAAASGSAPASAGANPSVLVRGLSIIGARLVSACDTEKTQFVTSEVNSGPLSGAYLVGQCRLVGESGVQVTFNRMTFVGETYAVNVTALDSATSSDSVAANIDRKLLARYVMPVVFTTLQAYMSAVARPQVSVTSSANTVPQVVTAASTGREAAAAGIAAGIGKAGESLSAAKPTAFIPIDAPLALLFNEPVLRKDTTK